MRYLPCMLAATLAAFSILSSAADAPPRGGGREACRADVEKLCPQIKPGEGRIAACLRQNESQISDPCKGAIAKMRDQKKAAHTPL